MQQASASLDFGMPKRLLFLAALIGCGGSESPASSFSETCNGVDDDSDGLIDEDGASLCWVPGATSRCGGVSGCQIDQCLPGTADCNGELHDGCESAEGCGTDAGTEPAPIPDAGLPFLSLGFGVSNLGSWAEGRSFGGDLRASDSCFVVFDTTVGEAYCDRGRDRVPLPSRFDVVAQEGGFGPSETLGVFSIGSLDASRGRVLVRGSRPAVILSQGPIVVGRTFVVLPDAGGWPGVTSMLTRGEGLGGGYFATGTFEEGGEGGAYCTLGDPGADQSATAMRASTYGNPMNVPLLGGSSGGARDLFDRSGAGGGALVLVSAQSISVEATGEVRVNGANGTDDGGGGSGGALILEAPRVSVAGTLSATGGDGFNAGGSGGLGRIRINTNESTFAFDALVTPAPGTACFSEGALLPLGAAPMPPSCSAADGENERCAACVATFCCSEAAACEGDPVCMGCRATSERGPGCAANGTLTTYESCLRGFCPDACRGPGD